MTTIAERIEKIREGLRKDADKAEREIAILQSLAGVLPDNLPVNQIHTHNLYGSVASVQIGDSYASYGREETRQDLAFVANLLDLFPPAPIYKIRNGCIAFRPDWHVSDEEAAKDNAELIWGVTLTAKPDITPTQKIEWFTEKNGVRFELSVILRPQAWPVRWSINTRTDRRTGKVLEVLKTSLSARGSFWLDQKIKYVSGSSEYAGDWRCYWLAVDDSAGAGQAWRDICGDLIPAAVDPVNPADSVNPA